MANINLDGGINYSFARSQENTIILDSENHCHATKSFANTVVISGSNLPFGNTYLTVGHDTTFGGSSNRPLVVLSHVNDTVAANTNTYHDFQLALHTESQIDNSFSGIVFKNGTLTSDVDNYGAAIKAIRTTTSVATNDTDLTFWTNSNVSKNCDERMRIDSDGKVGIGDTAPNQQLTVKGTNAQISIEESDTEFVRIGVEATGGDMCIGWDDADDMHLGCFSSPTDTTISTKMIIQSTGDVGIGTTGPSSRLDVEHTTTAFDYISIVNSTAALDTVKAFAVQRQGSERLVIHSNGDVDNTNNSYGALSDSRLKENIITGSSQWNDIKNLKFKNFNLIGDDLTQLGVLAQDLEASGMSGLVNSQPATESHIALNSELDGESVKSVKYSILNLKAIKALQEAMDKIESLEQRITTLENN